MPFDLGKGPPLGVKPNGGEGTQQPMKSELQRVGRQLSHLVISYRRQTVLLVTQVSIAPVQSLPLVGFFKNLSLPL